MKEYGLGVTIDRENRTVEYHFKWDADDEVEQVVTYSQCEHIDDLSVCEESHAPLVKKYLESLFSPENKGSLTPTRRG